MKIRNSTTAAFSTAFLLALILNLGVAAQTSETKNQPEIPKTDYSDETRKSRRTVKLKDDFKTAIKNKKADWTLTTDKNLGWGGAFLIWEMKDKTVKMQIHDYETVKEASRGFDRPLDCQVCTPNIPQNGFGDESYLHSTNYPYGKEGVMTLVFRSGNYKVSLTGTKDDIFSFGKIISDTISEQKKSVSGITEVV
ncbi:MAG TPA: hypothetical protein VNI84_06860 [Pyrinomonadaceae bacterium]|nr:hypothetical protein [Pyrinomonadaceae bacterium]